MRDKVHRNTVIADENINSLPSGHPATDKFEIWSVEISDMSDEFNNDDMEGGCGCGPKHMDEAERQKRMDEMDEVIKEDIDRL